MARTRFPALGLAVASFIVGAAGSSTALAQPADPQTAPAPAVDATPVRSRSRANLTWPRLRIISHHRPTSSPLRSPIPSQPIPSNLIRNSPLRPTTARSLTPPPYYGQSPYPQQPTYVAPNYPSRRVHGYTARFRPQFGLGLRVSGAYSGADLAGYGAEGIGADLLLRVHPRWTLEMQVQYQRVSSVDNYGMNSLYDRTDVPILGGARLHLGNPFWVVSPYLVSALGATYSQLTYDPSLSAEKRWFFEAQGGFGLEIRLGSHFMLDADLRAFGRIRSQGNTDVLVQDYTGNYVPALGNSGGIQFNFGFAGLF